MKILLHVISPNKIGGTRTVWRDIKDSYLNQKYELVDFVQEDLCGMNPVRSIMFINKYRKLINKHSADLIHVTGLGYSSLLIAVAARLSNVKAIIMSIHSYTSEDNRMPSWKRWLFDYVIEPAALNLSTKVFTVCKSALKHPVLSRCNKEKIYGVIYNKFPNIDTGKLKECLLRTELGLSSDKILVAVVGRVVEDKGHRYIIDAIKKLNDDRFAFIIVGSGDYVEVYKKELDVNSRNVFLLGNRNDVDQILHESDIFLFASLHENHSKALLEAANMNCAIISTDVGGNPEIVDHGKSGILISPRDSDAIVYAMKLLLDVELRETLSRNARTDVATKFSESNTIGELERLYNQFLV